MDTPTPTSPAKGTAPTPAPAAKGGIVGAPSQPTAPRQLAWIGAAVLALHLGALGWWLTPAHPERAARIAEAPPMATVQLAAMPPAPVAVAAQAHLTPTVTPAITPTAAPVTTPNLAPPTPDPTPPDSRAPLRRPPPTASTASPTETGKPHPPASPKVGATAGEPTGQATPSPTAPTAVAGTVQAQPPLVTHIIYKQNTDFALSNQAQSAIDSTPTETQSHLTPTSLTPTNPTLANADLASDGEPDTRWVVAAVKPAAQPAQRVRDTPGALADTAAGPLRVPPSATLSFQVTARRKGLAFPASSTLRWVVDGSNYSASLVIEAPFVRSRSQTSVGRIDPELGLQPRRFGDKNRTELATHFDRSRTPAVIRFSANAPSVPLQAQSQDRLSVLFQLAAQVAGAPQHFTAGQRATFHTAGSRDAESWVFRVVGTDHLSLPAGSMDTVHLVREAESAYDNRVDVWLAPDLNHLPVRILWTQTNGDQVDQALSDHTP